MPKTTNFGTPNSHGIDRTWRSASDYPIDTPPIAKKCDGCRFYGVKSVHEREAMRAIRFCTSPKTVTTEVERMFPDRLGVPLDMAREICDREGDGFFVYFEPKEPTRGVGNPHSEIRDPQSQEASGQNREQ